MYHKVNIQKLSANQIAKLLRGQRVRVKHGQGQALNLSAEQVKKVMSAHRKGAGCCVQLDPYQCDMHRGEGFFDTVKSVARSVAPIAVKAGKAVAPIVIDAGSDALKGYLAGQGMMDAQQSIFGPRMAVQGLEQSGRGVARAGKRSAPHRGRGFASNVFKAVAPVLVDAGADALKKKVSGGALYNAGYGVDQVRTRKGAVKGRRGKGNIGSAIGSALGEIFLPF